MERSPRLIMVAVDDTQTSVSALDYAISMVRPDDKIWIFHVIPSIAAPYLGDVPMLAYDDREDAAAREEAAKKFIAEHYTSKLVEKGIPHGVTLDKSTMSTDVADIAEAACSASSKIGASLLIVSRHNKGAIQEFFVGSVTTECLRRSKVPVLVFTHPELPHAPKPNRTILVMVDETKAGSQALDYTIEQVCQPGDKVCLFHIIPHTLTPVMLELPAFQLTDTADILSREEAARTHITTTYASRLEKSKIQYEVSINRAGRSSDVVDIAEAACQKAEDLGADLIVLTKHQKGVIQEFFVGSVTSQCVKQSKMPVLVFSE